MTEIVHGAENVSLDAFLSVGNLDLAGRILFLVRWKLYKEILSVPLHISFVQKLRYVRSDTQYRMCEYQYIRNIAVTPFQLLLSSALHRLEQ